MFIPPMTDLALDLRQSAQAADLRARLLEAGYEMTTGLAASFTETLSGNVGEVFEIDRSLALLGQHTTSLALAANRAAASQAALGTVLDTVGTLGVELEGAVATDDAVSAAEYARSATQKLESVVGALNTSYGGRYVFAGAAETTQPLDPAADIVADVVALMDAAPDAATALADIDSYFDDPAGGFATAIYNGSTTDAPGVLTPDGDRIAYAVRADDPALRDMMKGLATAAAFHQSTLSGTAGAEETVLLAAAGTLQAADDALIAVRATLGTAEEAIETTRVSAEAEAATLELAKVELVGVDQYEATTRFANLENQLTSLYTVTARISNLSFTNFLR